MQAPQIYRFPTILGRPRHIPIHGSRARRYRPRTANRLTDSAQITSHYTGIPEDYVNALDKIFAAA